MAASRFVLVYAISAAAQLANVTTATNATTKLSCDDQRMATDLCFQNLLLINDPSIKFPRTERQVSTEYCPSTAKNLACISDARPCLSTTARPVFGVLLRSLKRFVRATCKSKSARQEMVDNLKCMADNSVLRRLSHEMTTLLNVAARQSDGKVIPYVCCSYHYGLDRTRDAIKAACDKRKVGVGINFFENFITSTYGEGFDLVCGNLYPTATVCESKIPETMAEIKKVASAELGPVNTTIMYPALAILDVLGGDSL